MESITIKAMEEYYPQNSDMRNLITYIAGECKGKEKVRYCNGKDISKRAEKAAGQMIKLQKLFGKANKRRLYHFIVSFPGDEDDANFVKLAAEKIVGLVFKDYAVYYGVHEDTECLHIHFAVNAVSHVDGKKWHKNKKEFEKMKKEILQIVEEVRRDGI